MKSKEKKRLVVILSVIILLLLAAAVAVYVVKNNSRAKTVADNMKKSTGASVSQASDDTITYDGQKYKYNKNLTNILFMGVDKKETVTLKDTPGVAGQADCIMIISLDKEAQTARILQVSRDSMTDIDIYDANGNYYTSVNAQLATQYAYGNAEQSSCWAMKKTVSELLFDLPIDGYVSLNIDAISTMNDAVGGVEITIPEDYTAIDPAFVKGETVKLTGEQAEKYVRYRDINMQGSNNGRMQRQVQYIPALISALRNKVGAAGDYYEAFYPVIKPYLVTDLNADQINDLARYQLDDSETAYVPGEAVAGAEHEEFHVDDVELQKLLIEMFYQLRE